MGPSFASSGKPRLAAATRGRAARGASRSVLALAAILAFALGASAAEPSPAGPNELGVVLERADSFKLEDTGKNDRAYDLAALRWSTPLRGFAGLAGPGRWRCHIELAGGAFTAPRPGSIVGVNAGLRYYFRKVGRVLPHAGLGVGFLYTWFPLLDSPLDFTFFPSVGVEVFLTPRLGLDLGYRMQHISNGGLKLPNVGLNSHLLTCGLLWRYGG